MPRVRSLTSPATEVAGLPLLARRIRRAHQIVDDRPIEDPQVRDRPVPARPARYLLLQEYADQGRECGQAIAYGADPLALLSETQDEIADGWVPMMIPPAQMRDDLARLSQLCAETGRDFDAMDITVVVPAISMGLGTRPEWAYDLPVQDKDELLAGYADARVDRLIIGVEDMVDDSAFKNLEAIAKGLGLS